jgi:hypothetical protein
MNVTLREWLDNGWLVEHKTSREEIASLLALADRDLANCRVPGLSSDWQLAIAYNATLQVATAALAAAGYRAAPDAHHYRVIQSLAYTIGSDRSLVVRLDQFRKKRNVSAYDRTGTVSEREAKEMIALANRMRKDVQDWLQTRHPELIETR